MLATGKRQQKPDFGAPALLRLLQALLQLDPPILLVELIDEDDLRNLRVQSSTD